MKKEIIDLLVRTKQIRPRVMDKAKIKSMVDTAQENIRVVERVALDTESATLIFREYYESIRQLGDAQWWILGYEPRNHEVSMDILKENDIKEKILLNKLLRFKKIRNNASYRGMKASQEQAQEIIEFWKKCSQEIIEKVCKEINQ